ncbi:Kinesin-like protein kif3a [Allomyces javanicus]|nr:Kinesin-like protein kif3a [Allomyces javanicus]
MPVPFEAILPLGIIATMFMVGGAGVGALQRISTQGKPQRINLDDWDRAFMARNERLTGHKYGQSENLVAPDEFNRSNPIHAEAVKVVVRCRPFSEKERAAGHSCIVDVDEGRNCVTITAPKLTDGSGSGDGSSGKPTTATPGSGADPPKSFTFDSVFDANCKQLDVYNKTARPIVESVLEGYNGTIFAFGQTGTGKTFSMEGIRDVPELRGIIPNSFVHVFSHIAAAPAGVKFLVRASYLEIYNEEVRDLLSSNPSKLDLKEHPDMGVYVKDLSSFVVKDVDEMDKLMNQGNKNRSVGFTEMNARSSRSHSIFTITIEMSETRDGKECIRAGKLHLVDLAGSERQSKTGATGDRLKEATKINLSLSCLGNVIKALVDGKASHIPYRDSKLTRLLQDSLGGNAKTMMIATMSPASYNYEETISTLRYASRAKNIKNKPKVNEDPKDAMLRMFQEEIARLKAQLETDGAGGVDEEDDEAEGEVGGADEASPASLTGGSNDVTGSVPGTAAAAAAAAADGNASASLNASGMERRKKAGLTDEEMRVMEERIEQEKRAILESKDMIESEKQTILAELNRRQEEIDHERRAREELVNKLEQMESKLLVGGVNILDKEVQQREELARQSAELEERKRQQLLLHQQLQQEEEAALQMEEEYNSLQDEAAAKTQKIKKLWTILMTHKAELKDLTEEYQREREDLLDTIRDLSRELKWKMKLVERCIPDEEMSWIESQSTWDEVNEQWHVRFASHAGNNIRGSQHGAHRHFHHLPRAQQLASGGGGGGGGLVSASPAPGMDDINFWTPVYPTEVIYLSYDGQVRPTGNGRTSALSSAAAASMRGKANSPNGHTARPQAARTKSGARSTVVAASAKPKVVEDAPTARGLVTKPKHYA